jgi:hypothetical protein
MDSVLGTTGDEWCGRIVAHVFLAQHVEGRSRSIKFHNSSNDQNCSINLKR